MVGISSLDVLGLFRFQISFQLAPLLGLGIRVYQQHEGISSLQSIQHHICYPYRDHNDELWVWSLMFQCDQVPKFLRTRFLWALSICGRIRRTCCLNENQPLSLSPIN